MKLIILLLVLALERFWRQLVCWRADRRTERAFTRAYQSLADVIGKKASAIVLWLALPAFVWWFVATIGAGFWSVILYIVFSLVVLVIVLAPRQAHVRAQALADACHSGDDTQALQEREDLTAGTTLDPSTARPQQLAERIIVLGFHEWFAVLFWFVVAGPAGALLYRLTDWLAQPQASVELTEEQVEEGILVVDDTLTDQPAAATSNAEETIPVEQPVSVADDFARIQGWLDWPAARVFALLLLLAGGFNRGWSAWMNGGTGLSTSTMSERNLHLISRVGHASLELEREDECADAQPCLMDQSRRYKDASSMVLRALMLGLGGVALITLSGWIR
ncbi:regulatory signaling modulator protein AmpE [Halothiobacillus sp.]|uniref:regulatory signaling modulator protein AmpE n=1 Tax=Halothiobacillus sp. TaxID=1891311 RepID=UPI002AD1E8C8|nr:regulatory signaling modulator protein AmpE [Halothiobacillus sp.]